MLRKILSLVLSFMLFFSQAGIAAVAPELNIAAYLGKFNYSPPDKLRLPLLRYFSYDNLNNNFKLILDKGDFKEIKGPELKDSSRKLLSYFLIGITLPNESFWVNLRPDSSDNIIDDYLAQTDVGKILLEADLQLKKDTARFTSPQTPEGKLYWDKLYQKAGELFGSENITIPTLTRPWIVPGEVIIRESQDSAYVYKASLKVMLEQDHLKGSANYNFTDPRLKALNEYSSQLIREFILPKLTKEVNISKRYAQLRQVYYSLVLSRWFKARFYGKGGIYASAIDKKNLNGLLSQGNWSKNTYFKEYQKSFQQGEYNLKAQAAGISGQNIRSYFSGGIALGGKELDIASSPIVGGFVGNKALDFAGRLPGVHLFGNPDLNNLLPDRLSSSPAGSNDRFNALQDRVRLMEIDRRLGDLAPKIARSDERMQGIRISVHMSSFSEERYRESRALRGEKFDLEQEKAQIKERQRRGGSSPAASPVVNEVDLSNIIPIVTINTANPVTLNGSIDLDSIGDGLVLYEVRKAEGDKTFGVPHIKITRSGQTIRIYGADDSEIEPIGINEWNCELHSSHQLRFVRIGNELRLILNNMIPATEKVYALYRIRDSVASSPVQAGAATSSPVRVADVLRANLDKSISLADLMKQTGLLQAQLAIILPYFMYGGYGGENFELKVSPEAGLISVAQGGYSMTELYNQRITTPAGVEALRALIKTKILAIWVPSAASPSTSSGLVVSESATGGRVEPTSSPAKVAFKEAKAREWLRSQGLSFLSPTFLQDVLNSGRPRSLWLAKEKLGLIGVGRGMDAAGRSAAQDDIVNQVFAIIMDNNRENLIAWLSWVLVDREGEKRASEIVTLALQHPDNFAAIQQAIAEAGVYANASVEYTAQRVQVVVKMIADTSAVSSTQVRKGGINLSILDSQVEQTSPDGSFTIIVRRGKEHNDVAVEVLAKPNTNITVNYTLSGNNQEIKGRLSLPNGGYTKDPLGNYDGLTKKLGQEWTLVAESYPTAASPAQPDAASPDAHKEGDKVSIATVNQGEAKTITLGMPLEFQNGTEMAVLYRISAGISERVVEFRYNPNTVMPIELRQIPSKGVVAVESYLQGNQQKYTLSIGQRPKTSEELSIVFRKPGSITITAMPQNLPEESFSSHEATYSLQFEPPSSIAKVEEGTGAGFDDVSSPVTVTTTFHARYAVSGNFDPQAEFEDLQSRLWGEKGTGEVIIDRTWVKAIVESEFWRGMTSAEYKYKAILFIKQLHQAMFTSPLTFEEVDPLLLTISSLLGVQGFDFDTLKGQIERGSLQFTVPASSQAAASPAQPGVAASSPVQPGVAPATERGGSASGGSSPVAAEIDALFPSALRGDKSAYERFKQLVTTRTQEVIDYFEAQVPQAVAALPVGIFGMGSGYDIRGNVLEVKGGEVDFTPINCYVIGKALGTFYAEEGQGVTITGDQRWHTPTLRLALALGFLSVGVYAGFSEEIFGTGEHGIISGANPFHDVLSLQLSGSHGVPEKNGLKIKYNVGHHGYGQFHLEPLYYANLEKLGQQVKAGKFREPKKLGILTERDTLLEFVVRAYDRTLPELDPQQPIVFDCRNSANIPALKELVKRRGMQQVRWLNDIPLPTMPVDAPWDPSKPQALKASRQAIEKWNAELAEAGSRYRAIAFIFDGDGDRTGIILEDGTVVSSLDAPLFYYERMMVDPLNQQVIDKFKKAGVDPIAMWLALDIRSNSRLKKLIAQHPDFLGVWIQLGYPPQREYVAWVTGILDGFVQRTPALNGDADFLKGFQHLKETYFTAEASGHLFFHNVPLHLEKVIDSGIAAAFRLAYIKQTISDFEARDQNLGLSPGKDSYSLAELFRAFPQAFYTDDIRIIVPNSIKFQLTQRMAARLQEKYKEEISPLGTTLRPLLQKLIESGLLRESDVRYEDNGAIVINMGVTDVGIQDADDGAIVLDGLKLQLKSGGSILFRSSNTGEQCTLIFEGSSLEHLLQLMAEVEALIREEVAKFEASDDTRAAANKVDLSDFINRRNEAIEKYSAAPATERGGSASGVSSPAQTPYDAAKEKQAVLNSDSDGVVRGLHLFNIIAARDGTVQTLQEMAPALEEIIRGSLGRLHDSGTSYLCAHALWALRVAGAVDALKEFIPSLLPIVRQSDAYYFLRAQAIQALLLVEADGELQHLKSSLVAIVGSYGKGLRDYEKPTLFTAAIQALLYIGATDDLQDLRSQLAKIAEEGFGYTSDSEVLRATAMQALEKTKTSKDGHAAASPVRSPGTDRAMRTYADVVKASMTQIIQHVRGLPKAQAEEFAVGYMKTYVGYSDSLAPDIPSISEDAARQLEEEVIEAVAVGKIILVGKSLGRDKAKIFNEWKLARRLFMKYNLGEKTSRTMTAAREHLYTKVILRESNTVPFELLPIVDRGDSFVFQLEPLWSILEGASFSESSTLGPTAASPAVDINDVDMEVTAIAVNRVLRSYSLPPITAENVRVILEGANYTIDIYTGGVYTPLFLRFNTNNNTISVTQISRPSALSINEQVELVLRKADSSSAVGARADSKAAVSSPNEAEDLPKLAFLRDGALSVKLPEAIARAGGRVPVISVAPDASLGKGVEVTRRETRRGIPVIEVSQGPQATQGKVLEGIGAGLKMEALRLPGSKTSSPLSQDVGGIDGSTSSPSIPQNARVGGIDFRSIPLLVQPIGNFSNLKFDNLPNMLTLQKINLDEEFKQISSMLEKGILPSSQRVKEFILACCYKKELAQRIGNLIPLLTSLCRLQEECVCEAEPELKESLMLVEAASAS